MKANTFQVEVHLVPAVIESSAVTVHPAHNRHSRKSDPPADTRSMFVQIDVPEGIPVDEVMKRFKNESRRVNTVMEVRPCMKPLCIFTCVTGFCS